MKQRAAAFLIACLPALLGVSFAGAAFAGFEEALRAFERKDDAKALAELRPLAEQGHAGAQYLLGVMYENGRDVPQDFREAVAWYRKAAEQGNARAQNNLGVMYENGRGVPQNAVIA